jgi:hypothetical protein
MGPILVKKLNSFQEAVEYKGKSYVMIKPEWLHIEPLWAWEQRRYKIEKNYGK